MRNIISRFPCVKNVSVFFVNRSYSKKSDAAIKSEQQGSYYTAKDIEFCPNRAKEVSQNYVLDAQQDICKDDPFIKADKVNAPEPQSEEEHAQVYQSFNSVSLHSVMQSNVPDPFTTESKSPTHLNMPGSSSSQGYKYLFGKLQNILQSHKAQ